MDDLTYDCSGTSGKKGCTLTSEGLPKPATFGMTDAKYRMIMKKRRVAQKAYIEMVNVLKGSCWGLTEVHTTVHTQEC